MGRTDKEWGRTPQHFDYLGIHFEEITYTPAFSHSKYRLTAMGMDITLNILWATVNSIREGLTPRTQRKKMFTLMSTEKKGVTFAYDEEEC